MRYKQYPSYKDSGVEWLGEIPVEWFKRKLKFSARIQGGKDQKQVLDDVGAYPVYGSGGIFGKANQFLYNGKSVLLGRKGTIDKPLFVRGKFWTVDTMYFTQIERAVSAKWFYYSCLTIRFDYYQYGSAVPSMTQEDLHSIQFATPSAEEQKAIANYLDKATTKIDTLIEKQTKLIELLKEKRQAVISSAVTRGLDDSVPMKDSGVEWLGGIPEHWILSRMKYVTISIIDTEHKTTPFYENGLYLVARTTNVKKAKLTLNGAKYTDLDGYKEWTKRGEPEEGDILLTREAPAGEACIVPASPILCLGQRMVLLKTNLKTILPEFILYSIYGGLSDDFIQQLSQGSTVVHFNMSDIQNIPLFELPMKEQQSIVNHINVKTSKIDNLITKSTQAITLLKEKRTALISAAVTGKIDVRDAA